jgi:hypothetical protein
VLIELKAGVTLLLVLKNRLKLDGHSKGLRELAVLKLTDQEE